MSVVRSSEARDVAEEKKPRDLEKLCFYTHILGDDSDDVDGLAEAFLSLAPETHVVCFRIEETDWFFLGTEAEVVAKIEALQDRRKKKKKVENDGPDL